MNKQDSLVADRYAEFRVFYDNRKAAVFREKGKEYIAKNSEGKLLAGFQVDDGIIQSKEMQKCDKALLVNDERLYLIEFKGADIDTACEQLLSTYEFFLKCFKRYEYCFRVVLSRTNSKHSASNLCPTSKRRLLNKIGYKNDENKFKEKCIRMEEDV
ncbi:MAG: hypothetical protein HDR35_03335 [Treponema sp.]|nr:hypothetical protein [Treponema sp.]